MDTISRYVEDVILEPTRNAIVNAAALVVRAALLLVAAGMLAVLLQGCVTPSSAPLSGGAKSGGIIVVGTLADANNPLEMAIAPELTRVVVLRKRALAALQSGRIDAGQAQQIQDYADDARSHLDRAAAQKSLTKTAKTEISAAQEVLKRGETYHDGVTK